MGILLVGLIDMGGDVADMMTTQSDRQLKVDNRYRQPGWEAQEGG